MVLDDCKILLDCGWNDRFDVSLLRPLASVAKDIDAVLISHSDTEHLGALPYAFGKLGMNCKVYTTLPVHKCSTFYSRWFRRSHGDTLCCRTYARWRLLEDSQRN